MSMDVFCNGIAPASSLMLTPRLPALSIHREGEGGGLVNNQTNPEESVLVELATGIDTRPELPLAVVFPST